LNEQKEFNVIKLEKFKKPDYDRLIRWIDSEELMVIFSAQAFSFPITHQQIEKYIKSSDRIAYKVIDTTNNEIIGHAEFKKVDYINKSARICRVLVGDKKNRNKGYGSLIIKELVRVGLEELQLHRIDLGVYDFNKQAIKCYQKCGFEIEGLLKDNIKFNDIYWSTYNMSILNKK
jgi:RimJ/RimL family protein N-acetyltransferase